MKFFSWIFSTLIAVVAVVFAVSNMQEAEIFYSPFETALMLPVSVIALGSMALGFFFGGLFIWCLHGPLSTKADKKRAQVYGLIKENEKLKEEKTVYEAGHSKTLLISK